MSEELFAIALTLIRLLEETWRLPVSSCCILTSVHFDDNYQEEDTWVFTPFCVTILLSRGHAWYWSCFIRFTRKTIEGNSRCKPFTQTSLLFMQFYPTSQ
jgi:hypothetical protein